MCRSVDELVSEIARVRRELEELRRLFDKRIRELENVLNRVEICVNALHIRLRR